MKMLWDKFKVTRFLRLPTSGGMEVKKWLKEKSRWTNWLRFPSEDGNSHVRLFEGRLRCPSFGREETWGEMLQMSSWLARPSRARFKKQEKFILRKSEFGEKSMMLPAWLQAIPSQLIAVVTPPSTLRQSKARPSDASKGLSTAATRHQE